MANRTHSERREAGQDVLRTLRGGKVDGATAAAANEARLGALGSYVTDFALGDIWSRPGLSRRDRSLVVITILATLNQLNQLRSHVQGGIHHGLTRTEIEEIFVQLAGYAGFPRAIDATTTAHAAIADLQGVDALEPGAPATPKQDAERSADAKAVMRQLGANQPPGGVGVDMGPFTGTAGRFAFGELWSRPQLPMRDRSMVVCATLVTQDKPHELRFHLQAALNNGVTPLELEELMITVIGYAGFPTAVEGFRALREVEARTAGS
ncbi:MAG: carboxymuconolactone decarboxylase family protein [Acidimicrobiales bacterium]|nr:carboxymuconolactone decarboxylase family protein [Acidimicrobiales bacterium]